jgi:hypothetical protein
MTIRFVPRCGCGRELVARPCPYCAREGCQLCKKGEALVCPVHYEVARTLVEAGLRFGDTRR